MLLENFQFIFHAVVEVLEIWLLTEHTYDETQALRSKIIFTGKVFSRQENRVVVVLFGVFFGLVCWHLAGLAARRPIVAALFA